MFRLKGLPQGMLRLFLRGNHDETARVSVPAEAVEVDLIFPERPTGRE